MPGGRTHAVITLISAPLSAAAALGAGADGAQTLVVLAGHLSALVVQPDLDMISTIRVPLVGQLWSAYWYPYRVAISHREAWSHAPIVGTLMRAGYLMPIWALAWCSWPTLADVYLLWMCGLVLPDILHAIADAIFKN